MNTMRQFWSLLFLVTLGAAAPAFADWSSNNEADAVRFLGSINLSQRGQNNILRLNNACGIGQRISPKSR